MKLFLDSSVVLAACGSANGASREVFRLAIANGWTLVVTPYVIAEVELNLPQLPPAGRGAWPEIQNQLSLMNDVFTLDRPVVFDPAKDRPVLFAALAWADVLLTLDQADFGSLMGGSFYGLRVIRPGSFLAQERADGRLR